MQFLQPILLWGLLGISIPILIHLWRGRRGQLIHWAAMHWLTSQESSVTKGFRLENLLVLFLRILALTLLVLLLSQVFLPALNQQTAERVVHLVQPDKLLAEEFRFELQQALNNGDEVYWADGDLTALSLGQLNPENKDFKLQASLDLLPQEVSKLVLYLGNSQQTVGESFYRSPIQPNLVLGTFALQGSGNEQIQFSEEVFFQVNEEGILDSISGESSGNVRAIQMDQLSYYFADIEDSEAEAIEASLEAIQDVYGLEFQEVDTEESAKLIFAQSLPKETATSKLYFVTTEFSFPTRKNLLIFSDTLDFEHAELVQNGRLPELILEKLLEFYDIEQQDAPWSLSQLSRRFLVAQDKWQEQKPNLNLLLLGLLLLCLALERYFANRQGV
ncbi:BatA domain-containing protein [Algoriphagus halophytocola]|uniref:BatA domain-containing protein n=1 Tax=Algoriphagus halophytocola TaxID=2991499 RepID=UPI0022DE4883|nr:BatA domain-containing protein [Algoriphagus sp. TR-M9]WBL41358.1 BatA domain-containing protein [Algoriphagus sp. TR-M9]